MKKYALLISEIMNSACTCGIEGRGPHPVSLVRAPEGLR
jgi:hypothetical protein